MPLSTASSSIGKIPASCEDLQQIGHKKSGLYSVMGSNAIQTVYCDFIKSSSDSGTDNSKTKNVLFCQFHFKKDNSKALQKWIGFADVQSLPIRSHHFLRSEKRRLLHKKCSDPIREFCNQHRWSHG